MKWIQCANGKFAVCKFCGREMGACMDGKTHICLHCNVQVVITEVDNDRIPAVHSR